MKIRRRRKRKRRMRRKRRRRRRRRRRRSRSSSCSSSSSSSSSVLVLLLRCTHTGRKVVWTTQFCMLEPNICRFTAWNLFPFTLLTPRTFRYLPNYWKFSHPYLARAKNSCKQCFVRPTEWLCTRRFLSSVLRDFSGCQYCIKGMVRLIN